MVERTGHACRRRGRRLCAYALPTVLSVGLCVASTGAFCFQAPHGVLRSPLQQSKSKRGPVDSDDANHFYPQRSLAPFRNTASSSHLLRTTALSMSLIPLPVEELQRLVATGTPTGSQYSTYWGRTQQEQYARVLESAIVTFLGVFFSYFMSFVLGGFVATLFGCLFCFWGILSPEFKARSRNWEFLGGRQLVDPWTVMDNNNGNIGDTDPEHAGLYGALFLGRIGDVCVVEDVAASEEFDLEVFADYNMETDELERYTGQPYLLRVECIDSTGRKLQLHARLSEEYLDLRPGMPVTGILLSTSPRFTRLAALTDLYVPGAACWIGDYPYLDRAEVEALLAEDDEIWDALQAEEVGRPALDEDRSMDDEQDLDDDTETTTSTGTGNESREPVYSRRRR